MKRIAAALPSLPSRPTLAATLALVAAVVLVAGTAQRVAAQDAVRAGAPGPGRPAAPAAASARTGARAASAPRFTPCRLEHPSRLLGFAAECTTIEVAEDPARPAGRRIALFVARVPAVSRRKAADPVFLIAGGPGMGTTAMYPAVAAAFERLRRDRDLVLLDQRGTGRSAPLGCALDDEQLLEGSIAQVLEATRRCLAELAPRADLAQYTTSVAVRDLDAVRAALGYERIDLYGVSYGTRVAQHYLRRHAPHVRSVILDGVVPPGLALGPDMALDAEAALQRILARCDAEPKCHGAFGDTDALYRGLRARLAAAPVEVTLPDPVSARPRTLRFGERHLGAVLRLSSYASAQAALLPLALHEAATVGNFVPLAGLFLVANEGLREQLAYGMHNSVVCTEDLPFVDAAKVDRARLAATYLGTEQLDALRAICATWPRGALDADLRAPLRSEVPVLLLSGSDDPVTPPANAEAARRGLAHSRHLVLPGQGHGQVGASCMDRVFADFVRSADPARLDARCLQRVRPVPFFTSLAGPPP
ncbi:MAG: alpha/beta hydrolase [Steroidobacteraceae bacterium]